MNHNLNAALGAMLGAALGDALGVHLEFENDVTPEKIERALTLPGGGHWKVGPGECSDDTELQISLGHALRDGINNTTYDQKLNTIARNYICWIRSFPFDCGGTTARAFSIDPKASKISQKMMEQSAACNHVSEANGNLMRITPIAVWGHKLKEVDLVKIARNDALLSHPNQTTQDCATAYCIAISYLINHPKDAKGAIIKTISWALQNACRNVKDWLTDSQMDCSHIDCSSRNIGWVKWGFTLAFFHLRLETPYMSAMRHVLSLTGDTDTNAAIVGGLLGAYWGERGLPKDLVQKMLKYDHEKHGGQKRPGWLSAKHLPEIGKELFDTAPGQLL